MDTRLELSLVLFLGFIVIPGLIATFYKKWPRKDVVELLLILGTAWLFITIGLYVCFPRW